jgi:oxygen-independent coproporphyrinogen-3 oxidase
MSTRASAAGHRPDEAEFADACGRLRAAYIHIPYCARVCPYCDFAVVEGRDDTVAAYMHALSEEIDAATESDVTSAFGPLDAVFIGGGTPSHIDPDHIRLLVARVGECFGLRQGVEVTLEANPEDWSHDVASRLRAAGVNRVSFGAQSLQAPTLEYLGRRHRPEDVATAVQRSREVGFDSISVDLIYGTPAETLDSWSATVDGVIGLDPDHISAYSLTVERGTPLSRAVNDGAPAPDPDQAADAYELVVDRLRAAGFVHYEVSNWARPGHACRYNMAVWAQGEYVAFGVGAHRHVAGERSWNIRKLDAYIQRGGRDVVASRERLDDQERERERIFIGLRRRAGVRAGRLGRRWAASGDFARLRAAGIADLINDRIVVTDPLRTDTAGRMLMAFTDAEPDSLPSSHASVSPSQDEETPRDS